MAEKMLVSVSTGVMTSLLGKLATLMGEKYTRLKDVPKQVGFLHEELSSMAALLEDLADMEGLDNQTKQWRNKVREMSYDIEDCIDDFTRRVGGPNDSKGFLRRVKTLRARHQLANQIQELKARVQEASARRMRYKLDDCLTRSGNVAIDPRMTALYTETSRLVGIDGPKEEVINLLTKKVGDASVQELRMVSIVGFGGLGKTTLANEVYRKVGESFGCKAFVSVSQRPDMMMLLKRLVKQILGSEIDNNDLQGHIDNIRKYLEDKRYLIVVDDIWDTSAWEFIKCAFPEGHNGSRVLTTTRIETVAVTCCNYQWEFVYKMKPLDDDNSRKLFHHRVFGLGNTCPQPFEEASNKILHKCGGLPLAIISVASLLASQTKRSISQWDYVFNSLRSDMSSNPTLEGMRQVLNLSYTHLPHQLKTCLLYIGLYPEDHNIERDNLVMQWVAEGFISGLDGIDALEIAGSYFNELVNRSMIIQFVDYNPWCKSGTCYKVHDMVLDLIVTKSAEENFLGVVENLRTITSKQKTRRLSLQFAESRLDENDPRMSIPHARSLFIFVSSFSSLQLFELKFLRVLFVWMVESLDLTPIGKLFQLRYLNITGFNPQICLPRQICGLKHLETFVISWFGEYSLPHDIVYLPALSFLDVYAGISYPDGISNMKSLHTLRNFDASKQSLDNLRALGKLQNLRELSILISDGCFNSKEQHRDALLSSIEKLINCNLRHLTVRGRNWYYDEWNSWQLSGSHLEQLRLRFYFPRLPGWIGQLSTLSSLDIRFVNKLCKEDIAVLAGLPALVRLVLFVRQGSIVFSSGTTFKTLDYFEYFGVDLTFQAGALPKVETLKLHMDVDEVITFQAGALPKVETLMLDMDVDEVMTCLRLAGFEHLPNLKNIGITVNHSSDEESEVPILAEAIRSFFDQHPGRPTVHLS